MALTDEFYQAGLIAIRTYNPVSAAYLKIRMKEYADAAVARLEGSESDEFVDFYKKTWASWISNGELQVVPWRPADAVANHAYTDVMIWLKEYPE